MLAATHTVQADSTCKTVFIPRSQSTALYRHYNDLMSTDRKLKYDDEEKHPDWLFNLAIEYNQNWNKSDLGEYFSPKKDK